MRSLLKGVRRTVGGLPCDSNYASILSSLGIAPSREEPAEGNRPTEPTAEKEAGAESWNSTSTPE